MLASWEINFSLVLRPSWLMGLHLKSIFVLSKRVCGKEPQQSFDGSANTDQRLAYWLATHAGCPPHSEASSLLSLQLSSSHPCIISPSCCPSCCCLSPPSSVLFLSFTLLISLFFLLAHPILTLMLLLPFFHPLSPAPKFLQPSPDSLHTSGLTFITVGCADKRISHLRLHQSCHVRSVKISRGGLGGRKCLKVSHKNSFIH